MITVDLDEIEHLIREVASSLGKRCDISRESNPPAQTLSVQSGVPGAADVMLTAIESGTLFWELKSGGKADWLVKNEVDLATLRDELRLMFTAVFTGSVSGRGVLTTGSRKFRLAAPGSPLALIARIGKHYEPYPAD